MSSLTPKWLILTATRNDGPLLARFLDELKSVLSVAGVVQTSTLHIVDDFSAQTLVENLITYMFDFDHALIGNSVNASQREMVVDLLASIRDIRLMDFSRKLS